MRVKFGNLRVVDSSAIPEITEFEDLFLNVYASTKNAAEMIAADHI